MHKLKLPPFAILFTLIFGAFLGCTKENHEAVVMTAVGLQTLHNKWVKDGRSETFDATNAVKSSVESFYIFTNDVSVAGTVYHCRFAARSARLRNPGAMAITDDGILLWIADKDGAVVVSPEKHGIRRY